MQLKLCLYGMMGKDLCPSLLQPFLENISRMSREEGIRKRFPVLYDPRRKGRPFSPVMDLTLVNLVGVSPLAGEESNTIKQSNNLTLIVHPHLA